MNIKKTIVASLLACMLPAVVMAKDVSIGVSMALFDEPFTITAQMRQQLLPMRPDLLRSVVFITAPWGIPLQSQKAVYFLKPGRSVHKNDSAGV